MRKAVDDKEFAEVVQRSRSMRQVIVTLGLVPNSTAYAAVRQRIERLGLATTHLHGLVEAVDDKEFAAIVARSGSIRQILLTLGLGAPSIADSLASVCLPTTFMAKLICEARKTPGIRSPRLPRSSSRTRRTRDLRTSSSTV